MASSQILDPQQILLVSDEQASKRLIKTFAMDNFERLFRNYHRDIVKMDFDGLETSGDVLRSTFNFVISDEMRKLLDDTKRVIEEKDKERLLQLHLVFLRKCEIFHKELEDYLKMPVPSPDLSKLIQEFKKKYGVEEIDGEAKQDGSCADCSIF